MERNYRKRSKVDSEKYQLAKYQLPIALARETSKQWQRQNKALEGRWEEKRGDGGGEWHLPAEEGTRGRVATAEEGGWRTLLEPTLAFVGL